MKIFLVLHKDSYTGRFLVIFPCICVFYLELTYPL
jgi:hypothetical protein